MTLATWPGTLPDDVLVDAYDEAFSDNVLRSPTDSGIPKKRKRFTAALRPLTVTPDIMTRTQVATLEAFYETTLAGGALNFEWTHPRTAATVEFGFRAPPRPRPIGGGVNWITTLELEIFP